MNPIGSVSRLVRGSDLPAAARHIMHVLCDRRRRGDTSMPTIAELARDTGMSRHTVTKHLAALGAGGWLDMLRDAR